MDLAEPARLAYEEDSSQQIVSHGRPICAGPSRAMLHPVQCTGLQVHSILLPLDESREPALPYSLMSLPSHRPMSAAPATAAVISFHALKTRCSTCSMRELC